MKYDDLTIQKLRELPIFDVCSKLGITLYGMGKLTRRATCWYHDDKHPSMHVNKKKNIYKCFVCGKGGDVLQLVQDYENLSFPEACDWLIREFSVTVISDAQPMNHGDCPNDSSAAKIRGTVPCDSSGSSRAALSSIIPLPSDLVKKSLSTQSEFCRALVSNGYLTPLQMQHAAARYRLGATKNGAVIFWEIDQQGHCRNGKFMHYLSNCHRDKSRNPTWAAAELKKSGQLSQDFENPHCFFGQHLINSYPDPLMGRGYLSERATGGAVKPPHIGGGLAGVDASFSSFLRAEEKDNCIAIVESEKTAVIMSEIAPEFIWLACGGLQMFSAEMLAPLTDYKLVIFPDTDETGDTYRQWAAIAAQASKLYAFRYPIRVSNLLESKASPAQKKLKIDIVDFLFKTE